MKNPITRTSIETPLGPFQMLFEEGRLIFAGFGDPVSRKTRIPALLRKHLDSSCIGPAETNQSRSIGPAVDILTDRYSDRPAKADVNSVLNTAIDQINSYFAGKSRSFDIPLKLYGSPFQIAVWDHLLKIESGATCTYGQVAAASGFPRAVRAVGSAVGSNPISVIVPCHRVLPASGGIGNYGGGADRKKFLLQLEHAVY